MVNVKRFVIVLAVIAGLLGGMGCKSTEPVIGDGGKEKTTDDNGGSGTTITEFEPLKPKWVNSLGEWEEDWRKDHKDEANRYLWVVGTSLAVESIEREQEAIKSASDNAIFELVRALGISVDTFGTRTEAWSNETRDLVIGSYKEALQTEMGSHDVNFKNHAWFGYVMTSTGIGGYTRSAYIKKGLYKLDKKTVDMAFVEDTAKGFAKKLDERLKENATVQKELVNRAKEATQKRMQELMGSK
ncbi:MAG: hypothetical protein HQ592_16765 [Planctomycetes bacterium]|nr:hypothetical protein [Planctomycetota bacterium]